MIGGGPAGIVSFYHLNKLNYKVLLIDKKNQDDLVDYPLSISIESKKILKNIGLWSDSLEVSPIKKIKVLNSVVVTYIQGLKKMSKGVLKG